VTAAERGLEVIAALGCELGEGPVWDDRDGRLAWVDILTGRLLRTDPRTGATVAVKVGGSIGALALRRSGGFVAAVDRAIWIVEDGPQRRIATLEPDDPRYRWNDGKADPWGRFLVATMQWAPREPVGTLWRLEADGRLMRVMDGLTIGNGLAWSQDGRALYYVDSALGTVDALDYDPATGMVDRRRVVVGPVAGAGVPDGMTIDEEGGLWVARWGGWAVHRYLDGRLDRAIRVPVAQPSSCTFGGPGLDELYVTSAWQGLGASARRAQPLAGALFRYRPGIRGRPADRYDG
jgi:sugar lactone lactonase YvrE